MYWEVDLTDGRTIKEDGSDIRHWGKLVRECHASNLEIVEFRLVSRDGAESRVIDKNADCYFVINDVIGVLGSSSRSSQTKRGIGSVRLSVCKTRTEWFSWPARTPIAPEVRNQVDDCLPEISVKRNKG